MKWERERGEEHMAEEERRVVQLSSQQIKLRKICAYISICVCVAGGGVSDKSQDSVSSCLVDLSQVG